MDEASNPASRYINYNKLLQQWQWRITYTKTCIWKVNELSRLFGKSDYEKHLMNISNSLHNIWNGTIWTGLITWLCADVGFY